MNKKDHFWLGALVATLAILIVLTLAPTIELSWLKAGFSVAIGWNIGRALILPIAGKVNRLLICGLDYLTECYYQWKEKK